MKTRNLFLLLAVIFLITCNTDDTTDEADDSITFESVITASDSPADGSPSLADLAAIGLNDLTESQEDYEVAIANANPAPTTLSELQIIIDEINDDDDDLNSDLPFGVNLAGADFGENIPGTFGTDYIYPNEEELTYYNSKGLKLIRLPFGWERIQPTLSGDLDVDELQRLKDFIQLVTAKNMYVILDLHNSARYVINGEEVLIGTGNVNNSDIKDLWIKLADEFKNETNIWGYGIMNEPNNMQNETHWFTIAKEIISGIRTVDTETTIVVGGDSWSSAERWLEYSDNLKDLVDPSDKLIYEAHVYFDNDASGQYLMSYDDEGATPNTGVNRVQPFIDWLQTNNLKGFIGEYGIPDNDERWLTTLDNFLVHLKDNSINGTYWAGGPWWGTNFMAIDPTDASGESNPLNGDDRPQMAIVEKYTTAKN